MGKPTILLLPNKVYHVWTHANGSENLFRENQNYHYFLQKYGSYINPVANTFAYCLMPNHLHLMIKIKSEAELMEWAKLKKPTLGSNELVGSIPLMVSKQFSHLFNGYTQAYNKLYRRMGSLFIPNFNRKHVDSESYYTRLIAYIHLNPVHHGFVTDPGGWPFSSWHGYLSDKSQMIARNEPIGWFSSKEAFRQFHKDFKKVDIWKDFDFN